MLSCVSITGVLGPVHPRRGNVRYLRYDPSIPSLNGRQGPFEIPVVSPLGPGGYFISAESGTQVFLKGRIDFDEELGIVLIHEFDEFLSMPTLKKR